MKFTPTEFAGLTIIQPNVFGDHRGYFFESYNAATFQANGLFLNFVQDNQSMSNKGAVRGLHFQLPPFAQGKLVRVLRGAVKDVVVDLRKGERTYGQHFSIILTGENNTILWIPEGFAHGFSTLENDTLFSYKCTAVYHKQSEGGVLWNDPDLGIDWGVTEPILSEKDTQNPRLKDFVSPF